MASLKDCISADRDTFINPNEFGEPVIYRFLDGSPEAEITAVLERWESPEDTGEVLRNFAEIWVKESDIVTPARGDIISVSGDSWTVIRISENALGLHCLECEGNIRPDFGRSRYA